MLLFNYFYIIVIYEVFENSSKIVIVMEYVSWGDFYDYISEWQQFSECEVRYFFWQIVFVVYYCYQNRVVY